MNSTENPSAGRHQLLPAWPALAVCAAVVRLDGPAERPEGRGVRQRGGLDLGWTDGQIIRFSGTIMKKKKYIYIYIYIKYIYIFIRIYIDILCVIYNDNEGSYNHF